MRQGVVGIALAAGLLVTAGLRMLRKSTAAPSAKHRIYVLRNNKGVEVHITPLGAIIVRLLVPDRNGQLDDIVLGYEKPSSYLVSGLVLGAFLWLKAQRLVMMRLD
jgi:galactose mutarotase-like enzyme